MSSTVRINSSDWMLKTFYGGRERGRCYEVRRPGEPPVVFTERGFVAFLAQQKEDQ